MAGGAGSLDPEATLVLASIVQSADAAIISKTLDGIVTTWNPSAERIFGYSAAEMIGRPIGVLAAPERPGEMERILERIRHGERVEQFETVRRRKDGGIAQILLTVSPIHDVEGRVVGASKIAQDLGPLKEAQAQLRAKSRQLDEVTQLLDLSPAMVCALDGRILLWGRGMQLLYGWDGDQAIGRFTRDLLKTEYPVPLGEIEDELMETGEWQGELTHIGRDGREVVVISHWALHRGGADEAPSVLKLDWDVTEGRRARSMAAEREARLRSIFDASPTAIITIDPKGIVQSFSHAAERLFGYAAIEVIGRNVKMLMPEPHHSLHDGYLDRYERTRSPRIIGIGREVEGRKKDGSTFPMDLAVGEVGLPEGRLFTGFIRDLSARVRLEDELRHSQKMEAIGQLTGGVAHDFNNLLTVISGNLELLERRLDRPQDREILSEAQEAAQLGAELSRRLLAFGRRQALQPKALDISALVGRMIELFRRTLGEAITIEARLGTELPPVLLDPGQIESALLNLAVNARDAMPQGGRLVIETSLFEIDETGGAAYDGLQAGHYVTLAVTDNGAGMSEETRRRAFEPFYTTKGPGSGSGLGLSMVYGFVKQSGGHVHLYSELGLGTTIRLYLPAQEGALSSAAPSAAAAAGRQGGARILVVEDDPRVRKVSVRRLEGLGHSVVEAGNAAEALKMLEGDRAGFDLLFTDVVMEGGMSGVDLAHEVRRRFPDMKILFTSGFAEPSEAASGILAGGADWLGKPYSLAELDGRLRELLG